MPHPPKLSDIARLAGVSTATVSRVLNEPDKVRAGTRTKVMHVVEAAGYTPHFGARALASNRTGIVGAVIPTMANAIFAQGIQAVEDALARAGKTLLIATSAYDPDREIAQVRTLIGRGIEALILIGQSRDGRIADMLHARGIPALALWTSQSGAFPAIGFDNRAAARQLARTVHAAGHTEVAAISGRIPGNDRARARMQGIEDVFGPLAPTRRIEADYTLADGANAASRLLTSDPAITALICGNDVLAAGALGGLRQIGLDCPGNVSVTGFDGLDIARAVTPQLTTIEVPHRDMGNRAADSILDALSRGAIPSGAELPVRLIRGASLAPLRPATLP